jgi:predicted metalloprotease
VQRLGRSPTTLFRPAVLGVVGLLLAVTAACGGSSSYEGEADASPSSTITADEADLDQAPERDRPNRAAETKAYEEVQAAALADLQDFWAVELPAVYGIPYTPIPEENLVAAGPGTAIPSCGEELLSYEEHVADNAFWCIPDDYMAWDDAGFLPELFEQFGPFASAMVLAHEWGHAIQDQAGTSDQAPPVIEELQADCFAGAWMGRLATGANEALQLDATAFDGALGGLLRLRDDPGSDSDDPEAHGSGFDRVSAFQEGFEQGAVRCAGYLVEPPVVVQLPFADEAEASTGGDLEPGELIQLAFDDLNAYWVALLPRFAPVTDVIAFDATEPPSCGGEPLASDDVAYTMFFCEADGAVHVDVDLVRSVHDEIGDFGIATLLALQWGVSAQLQDGQTDVALAQGLQQSCFAGSWSSHVEAGGSEGLSLSPGDLDEAISAFLAFSETPDEQGRTQLGTAFERVQAFRVGFLDGEAACAAYTEGG